MSVFRSLRNWLTGVAVYESAPITLMDTDAAQQWVADHPRCSQCGQSIDHIADSYCVTNDSVTGIAAHHITCPQAVPR